MIDILRLKAGSQAVEKGRGRRFFAGRSSPRKAETENRLPTPAFLSLVSSRILRL
jgi:hypothetical protein